MTGAGGGIRRIVVTLDADAGAPEALRALEAALDLAAEMQAEVEGLFVEDDTLFHLCELPGAQISLTSGNLSRPERGAIERSLRARAQEARARLERLAVSRHVAWSFRVQRGRRAELLVHAVRESDLMALLHRPAGLPAARIALRAGAMPQPAVAPVVAVVDELAEARPVLDVAARAAARARLPLLVLAPAAGFDRAAATTERLRDRHPGLVVATRRLADDADAVRAAVAGSRPRLLVLRAGDDVAQALRHSRDCDVWLVRA